MTLEQLISELRSLDVELDCDGEEIRLRPASRVSSELRTAIRSYKSELLKLFRERQNTSGGIPPELAPAVSSVLSVFPGAQIVEVKPHVDDGRPLPRIDLVIEEPQWLSRPYLIEKTRDRIRYLARVIARDRRAGRAPDPRNERCLVDARTYLQKLLGKPSMPTETPVQWSDDDTVEAICRDLEAARASRGPIELRLDEEGRLVIVGWPTPELNRRMSVHMKDIIEFLRERGERWRNG